MRGSALALTLALPAVATAEAQGEEQSGAATRAATTGGQARGAAPVGPEARSNCIPRESTSARNTGGYAQACFQPGADRSACGGSEPYPPGSGSYAQSHYQLGAGHEP